MEQFLLLCVGTFIGLLIGGLLSTAKQCDNEFLESHLNLITDKLREEEKNNKLLREANEALRDDYNKLKEKYDQNYIQLDALKAKCNKFFRLEV